MANNEHQDSVQAAQGDGEWKVVCRRKNTGKNHRPLNSKNLASKARSIGHSIRPRTTDLRSLEELQEDHRRHIARWEEETCSKRLRDILAANSSSVGNLSNAVCLGTGSFDPAEGGWEDKRKAYFQLIAFLDMVQDLEKATEKKIKCFFQEPDYNDSDRSFIASLGHEVVDTPNGFDIVGQDSFAFGVHLYREIYGKVLDSHMPAVFVGTDWDTWSQSLLVDMECLNKVKEMDGTYKKSMFPQDSRSQAFTHTCIYWRRATHENRVHRDEDETRAAKDSQGEIADKS